MFGDSRERAKLWTEESSKSVKFVSQKVGTYVNSAM